MRSIAIVLVILALAGSLAACGSGKKKSSGPSAQAQIKSAYVKFFSGKTPLSARVALLQNGSKFAPYISNLAKNPLAKNVSATVSSVTLQGSNKAKVVYTLNESGTPIPNVKNRTGSALLQNGAWKVGDSSFCALVALSGSTPPACKKM